MAWYECIRCRSNLGQQKVPIDSSLMAGVGEMGFCRMCYSNYRELHMYAVQDGRSRSPPSVPCVVKICNPLPKEGEWSVNDVKSHVVICLMVKLHRFAGPRTLRRFSKILEGETYIKLETRFCDYINGIRQEATSEEWPELYPWTDLNFRMRIRRCEFLHPVHEIPDEINFLAPHAWIFFCNECTKRCDGDVHWVIESNNDQEWKGRNEAGDWNDINDEKNYVSRNTYRMDKQRSLVVSRWFEVYINKEDLNWEAELEAHPNLKYEERSLLSEVLWSNYYDGDNGHHAVFVILTNLLERGVGFDRLWTYLENEFQVKYRQVIRHGAKESLLTRSQLEALYAR